MAVAHLGTAEVVSRSSFPCFGCSSGSSGCSCSLRGCDEMGNLDVSEGPGEEQRVVVVGQGDDEEDDDEEDDDVVEFEEDDDAVEFEEMFICLQQKVWVC